MLNLIKIKERIYFLEIPDYHILSMMFLRYQERYECTNERFRTHPFTFVEYMYWYTHQSEGRKFTYDHDWSGFNIPLKIIKEVHDEGIKDPNHYDQLMLSLYELIRIEAGTENCYLIAGEELDDEVFKHELAHAYFAIDEKYRNETLKYWVDLKDKTKDKIIKNLQEQEYGANFVDEAQAYTRDGHFSCFWKGKKPKDLKDFINNVTKLQKKYKLL